MIRSSDKRFFAVVVLLGIFPAKGWREGGIKYVLHPNRNGDPRGLEGPHYEFISIPSMVLGGRLSRTVSQRLPSLLIEVPFCLFRPGSGIYI